MWLIAAIGITLFSIFYDELQRSLGTGVYLLLGWIASLSGLIVWRRIGTAQVALLALGGVAYSLGALLLGLDSPTPVPEVFGAHELWHLAVLTGMGLHWSFMFKNAARPMDGSANLRAPTS